MKVALATAAHLPDLDVDDQLLLHAVRAKGLEAYAVVWDDSRVDWNDYDLTVIRSTWDYVPKLETFLTWAHRVSDASRLWNPAPVIEWNTRKTYLRDLEAREVPIVPTRWLQAGDAFDFSALLAEPGWSEIVVKPVVGASGVDTYRVHTGNLPGLADPLAALCAERDLMVQPFLHSVATHGESSLLYINGEFSHAVVKRPAPTDFRVQEHLGGTFTPCTPSPLQLRFADFVISQVEWPLLYGRVDVMLGPEGEMLLGELELVEPSMYLKYGPGSAERFADAIEARLGAAVS